MRYDFIQKHPDFIEVLENMQITVETYERNMKIASGFIGAGTVLIAVGLGIVGVQEQVLRRAK